MNAPAPSVPPAPPAPGPVERGTDLLLKPAPDRKALLMKIALIVAGALGVGAILWLLFFRENPKDVSECARLERIYKDPKTMAAVKDETLVAAKLKGCSWAKPELTLDELEGAWLIDGEYRQDASKAEICAELKKRTDEARKEKHYTDAVRYKRQALEQGCEWALAEDRER